MGLTDALSRSAARRAHVLLAEATGGFTVRAAVERATLGRGWGLGSSPADADVLAVCGSPGTELAEAIDRTWHQMPGPRTRVDVTRPEGAAAALERAQAALLDDAHHRRDAHERPMSADLPAAEDDEMAPDGIPLAEGGEDRDGLEMDVLRVPLGPVLPHWPPGLVLRCSLQGDVIADADVAALDMAAGPPPKEQGEARRCDTMAGLLDLAGWADAAAQARRARDEILVRGPGAAAPRLERLRHRVTRSWSLRWSLRGLRPVGDQDAEALGLPATATGDTYDRLLAMLADISGEPAAIPAGAIPPLVRGLDLAAARLVVASLHPQPSAAVREIDHAD